MFLHLLTIAFTATASLADQAPTELAFQDLWTRQQKQSHLKVASGLATEAQGISTSRASRHWAPHLFLDARAYTTNDPGTSLFSTLSQRAITPMDFSPDSLNHPERKTYERITLGAEWALFEGGMHSSLTALNEKLTDSKKLEGRAIRLKEYSNLALVYGNLLIVKNKEATILPIRALLDSTISRYSIGIKTNPVGHSGLLGMKALRNRLNAELTGTQAKTKALKETMNQFIDNLPTAWDPKNQTLFDFTDQTLSSPTGESFALQAQAKATEALFELKGAERARFLPKVALFGEGYWLNGARDSASAYTTGVYLQWDLFNASNFGAVTQARLNAEAMSAKTDFQRQMDRSETAALTEGIKAAKTGITLAEESLSIMEEQTAISQKLFGNGLINALQFTEVLSRRVDLVLSKTEAEERFLKMRSDLMNLSAAEITQ